MGHMRHHAIVVTSWDKARIEAARAMATDLFQPVVEGGGNSDGAMVTPVIAAPVNGYRSFAVLTDGSKEGWSMSDTGDEARYRFVTWLNGHRHADGSGPFDWAEIQYGDDEERRTEILRHSDERDS